MIDHSKASDRWAEARKHCQRNGDFLGKADSKSDQERRAAKYRKRRLRCAMAELYSNFGLWLEKDGDQIRGLHLQAAIRAHRALKGLGADKTFRIERVG